MMRNSLVALALVSVLTACSKEPPTHQAEQLEPAALDNQAATDALAQGLNLQYQVFTKQGNHQGLKCQQLGAEWASCHTIHLNLSSQTALPATQDWSLYFHSVRLILAVDHPDFTVTRLTGDLHKLTPTASFAGFNKGETIAIPLVAEFWSLFESDFMPRAYVIVGDAEPRVLASMDTEVLSDFVSPITADAQLRTADDANVPATALSRYHNNLDTQLLASSTMRGKIIPTPQSQTLGRDDIRLTAGVNWQNHALPAEMMAAVTAQATTLGLSQGEFPVTIKVDATALAPSAQTAGAYQLEVSPQGIDVVGFDNVGAYYGVQSLLSAITLDDMSIATMQVLDAPRYPYRGFMVDVARNFHSKEAILGTIEQMAAVKLNKLHLHLTDDEGWRLAIDGLPELTDIGANRCHDLSERHCLLPQLGSGPTSDNFGSGFYSRADYIDILRFAAARGIEVIPEIDMPAHSRAAVMSMEARYQRLMAEGQPEAADEYRLIDPQDSSNVTTVQFYDKHSFINPCLASSSRFAAKVMTEVKAMHLAAGVPLTTWHFGGDEAKNIKLGNGFQDSNAKDSVAWRGNLDLSKQDYPFAKSPVCQQLIASGKVSDAAHLPSYFAETISAMATEQGIPQFQAWQDGLKYSTDASAYDSDVIKVNFWDLLYFDGANSAYEWAQKGYQVIISSPDYVYLDMPYEVDPKERGYYWATRASDERKMFSFAPDNLPQNAETSSDRDGKGFDAKGLVQAPSFHGLSAQLWSETVRTDEQYEYMVFPRLLAVAERAWHQASWELPYQVGVEFNQDSQRVDKQALVQDWTQFANQLGQKQLHKLDKHQVQYRIPIPGAIITQGQLLMNINLPGLPLQYSLNHSDWQDYDALTPPVVTGSVWVRALSADGARAGRAITVHPTGNNTP
ncbi:beta-N-acetylhexosaminidase [Shewanella sp. NIFS-20-20]|uniref:beta-N-acetylhexosaminidase n=1 Tax=Shewanella sp. NIFS-20-20 TaxID=2853806 RepID=UPI001C43E9CE|nr:beta-N-acetylhexosaminidase [Shewanella sp. NIFS-20-20]MBV7314677.1 carbohydate-binding domain-containing protein [Shewanella sp. NIFS-20-20]